MHYLTELFGQPLSYWHDIYAVLCRYDIRGPKELAEVIAFKTNRTLKVFDSVNTDRLLGELDEVCDIRGPILQVMADCRTSVAWGVVPTSMELPPRAEFRVNYNNISKDGFTRRAQLTTSTPLNVLMRVREFRLPGESLNQARTRHYR